LKAALESVLSQTEQRWTVFIHDDASHINVRSIIEPYLNDPRITFARSEKRLGIGGNWNACLRQAKTPYVQFLFQDDLWEKDYLLNAVNILESHSQVGFVSVEHEYLFEGQSDAQEGYEALSAFKKENVQPGAHDGRTFLNWWMMRGLHPNVIGEPSFVMMRTSVAHGVGPFLEDMPQFLDVEYWTRLLQRSDWYFIPKSHGSFRVHASGASHQNQQQGRGLFDRLRCMERTMNALEGSARSTAKRAIAVQLSGMIGKFLNRKRAGKAVKLEGSGAVKSFLLRHPLLAARGFGMYLLGVKE
jgi:glycosyltransferase involved in cell wall biosynthesis